jgi:hypothetical protein
MTGSSKIRKALTATLVLMLVIWAEAGMALLQGDQVTQCSMIMHKVQSNGGMTCCPSDGTTPDPALATNRPPCCTIGNLPERPLGFVVSSEWGTRSSLICGAVVRAAIAAPAAHDFAVWRNADAPRFVRPVLELKTDLRV